MASSPNCIVDLTFGETSYISLVVQYFYYKDEQSAQPIILCLMRSLLAVRNFFSSMAS